jgi:hypothetical protein
VALVIALLALLAPVVLGQEEVAAAERAAGPAAWPDSQLPQPPSLGPAILEDPLTAPGVMGPRSVSPTGLGVHEVVGEGRIFKVAGPLREGAQTAGLTHAIAGLTVPDGEFRVEAKVVGGQERTQLVLWFRDQGPGQDGYLASVDPAHGKAQLLYKVGNEYRVLAERSDLASLLAPGDWNSLAVRLRGPDLWLLVGETPILSASEPSLGTGRVSIGLNRLGSLADREEAAAVFRNLRVSGLAEGDPARLPAFAAPAAASPAGEPWIGDLRFGYDPSGNDAVPPGGTLRRVDGGRIDAFFRWRNVPVGSKIKVERYHGKTFHSQVEHTTSAPNGTYRASLISFGAQAGGAHYFSPDASVVIYLDGRELTRGYVLLA